MSRISQGNERFSAKAKRGRNDRSGNVAAAEVAVSKRAADTTEGDTDVVRDGFILDVISGTREF